jgi:hypothetical protein
VTEKKEQYIAVIELIALNFTRLPFHSSRTLAKVNGNYICITKGTTESREAGEQFSIQLILLPILSFGGRKRRRYKLNPEDNLHEYVSHRLLNYRSNVPWYIILHIFVVGDSSWGFCVTKITSLTLPGSS